MPRVRSFRSRRQARRLGSRKSVTKRSPIATSLKNSLNMLSNPAASNIASQQNEQMQQPQMQQPQMINPALQQKLSETRPIPQHILNYFDSVRQPQPLQQQQPSNGMNQQYPQHVLDYFASSQPSIQQSGPLTGPQNDPQNIHNFIEKYKQDPQQQHNISDDNIYTGPGYFNYGNNQESEEDYPSVYTGPGYFNYGPQTQQQNSQSMMQPQGMSQGMNRMQPQGMNRPFMGAMSPQRQTFGTQSQTPLNNALGLLYKDMGI